MEMEKPYKLLFNGSIVKGFEINGVKANVASLFKIDENKVETLFSGKTFVLRQGMNYETAEKYKMHLEKAGIICTIQPGDDISPSESSESEDVMVCPKCGYEWDIGIIPDNYRQNPIVCPACKHTDKIKHFLDKRK